ncbi:MAG: 4Fe-4S dicluster domain-containing protein [Proteobacteria bacterium]|nr:4Fe-4S dicluster domain-containing protein [Pseudomonadota bacterium]MBU1717232.1 4Fe-4S dicluster domain-containing protein [Pseudomonadota bacterium]
MFAGLLFKSIEKQAMPGVVFEAGRCLRARLRSHGCERCLAVCPRQALTLDNNRIALVEERCTGCHACVSVCPGNAFVGDFDLLSLLSVVSADAGDDEVVLGCGRSPYHPNLSRLPCLGLLGESVLAGLHCLAKQEILLDIRSCDACENRQALDFLRQMIQGVADKAAPGCLRLRLAGAEEFAGIDTDNSRRSFLKLTKTSLLGLGRRTAEMLPEPGSAQDEGVGMEKAATPVSWFLCRAVALLPGGAEAEQGLLREYHYKLTVGESCDLCPACTGMCPTGALKRRRDEEGGRHLEFSSWQCRGCGLCVEFCKKKALTLRPWGATAPGTLSAMVIA